jgi:hypothetical protein
VKRDLYIGGAFLPQLIALGAGSTTTGTYRGQRVRKFMYKGSAPVTKQDQGVVWPKTAKSPT